MKKNPVLTLASFTVALLPAGCMQCGCFASREHLDSS